LRWAAGIAGSALTARAKCTVAYSSLASPPPCWRRTRQDQAQSVSAVEILGRENKDFFEHRHHCADLVELDEQVAEHSQDVAVLSRLVGNQPGMLDRFPVFAKIEQSPGQVELGRGRRRVD